MNQNFKSRYDEMRDNAASKAEPDKEVYDHSQYKGVSHARSLCLVWLDGKRMFLNYAYFVSAAFDSGSDTNRITLNFSTHIVKLSGFRLEDLFMSMMEHVPRIIEMTEERYTPINDQESSMIVGIQVESKENG